MNVLEQIQLALSAQPFWPSKHLKCTHELKPMLFECIFPPICEVVTVTYLISEPDYDSETQFCKQSHQIGLGSILVLRIKFCAERIL